MTVAELLNRIIVAYPGASPEAMKTFKPVFVARLQKHEGPALEEAATAVLSAFRPSARQPFPIPADFEQHLPSGKLDLAGVSIRSALRDAAENRRKVYEDWHTRQGAKIKANRPLPVYNACVLEASTRSQFGKPFMLQPEDIKRCEERALSQARLAMFGRPPATEDEWLAQFDQVRASWAEGLQEAA